jgi:hypothetical protein
MRRSSYLKRASKQFLAGTRYKSPVEAVEAGVRSLSHWAEVLRHEREAEQAYLMARAAQRGSKRSYAHMA